MDCGGGRLDRRAGPAIWTGSYNRAARTSTTLVSGSADLCEPNPSVLLQLAQRCGLWSRRESNPRDIPAAQRGRQVRIPYGPLRQRWLSGFGLGRQFIRVTCAAGARTVARRWHARGLRRMPRPLAQCSRLPSSPCRCIRAVVPSGSRDPSCNAATEVTSRASRGAIAGDAARHRVTKGRDSLSDLEKPVLWPKGGSRGDSW